MPPATVVLPRDLPPEAPGKEPPRPGRVTARALISANQTDEAFGPRPAGDALADRRAGATPSVTAAADPARLLNGVEPESDRVPHVVENRSAGVTGVLMQASGSTDRAPIVNVDAKLPLHDPGFGPRLSKHVVILVNDGVHNARLSLNPPEWDPWRSASA